MVGTAAAFGYSARVVQILATLVLSKRWLAHSCDVGTNLDLIICNEKFGPVSGTDKIETCDHDPFLI